MSKRSLSIAEMTAQLQKPGPALRSQRVDKMTAPLAEMGMQVTLDQLRPYDHNPRTERNPRYDEIKESIRQVGLKHSPPITQRPGDDKFMISDGGNTRLAILNELYEETGDDRFYRFWCVYRPWVTEEQVLAGHLSENENRADLSWIEKALGVAELKRLLEEDESEVLSQRELARRFIELGFSVSQSQISRMLYTVEHFWPTLPATLRSGIGQPQIKKLIAYREACLEIWKRCNSRQEADFSVAWHDVVSQFDYEEQTELPWSIVEDRLLGMLEDHSGAHLHTLDWCLKRVLEYRQRRQDIDDPEIWQPLQVEMERVRNPEAHPLKFYPPLPGEEDEPSKRERRPRQEVDTSEPLEFEPSGPSQSPPRTTDDQPTFSDENSYLRQELNALRAQNRKLLEGRQAAVASEESVLPINEHEQVTDQDSIAVLRSDDDLAIPEAEEEADLRTDEERINSLTLSVIDEPEGKRKLRHAVAAMHGGQAGDFQDFAVQSIPLMSAGPLTPVTDIWWVDAHVQTPKKLRYVIYRLAQSLGQWAGFPLSDTELYPAPLQLNQEEGLGYHLQPLSGDLEQDPAAQKVWQLLAALSGEVQPAYPSDISLIGDLLGTAGEAEHLPDEVLIRLFRLIRLVRVLRTQESTRGDS